MRASQVTYTLQMYVLPVGVRSVKSLLKQERYADIRFAHAWVQCLHRGLLPLLPSEGRKPNSGSPGSTLRVHVKERPAEGSGGRAQALQSGLGWDPGISAYQQCHLGQVPSLVSLRACHSQNANCFNLSRLYDSSA